MRRCGTRESGKIVSTLKDGNDAPTRVLLRPLRHKFREIREIPVFESELSKGVKDTRVEARGDQNQLGTEHFHCGSKLVLECGEHFAATGTRRKRAIHRS